METQAPATSAEDRLAAAEKALAEALAEALEERNTLWARLNEIEVDRLELEHLRRELYAIRASRTWKVMGRYQRLKRLVRLGLERLRQT